MTRYLCDVSERGLNDDVRIEFRCEDNPETPVDVYEAPVQELYRYFNRDIQKATAALEALEAYLKDC